MMPYPKFDNAPIGRKIEAKKKISQLVSKGYRLNPSRASSVYHQSIINSGSLKEKVESRRELRRRAASGRYD